MYEALRSITPVEILDWPDSEALFASWVPDRVISMPPTYKPGTRSTLAKRTTRFPPELYAALDQALQSPKPNFLATAKELGMTVLTVRRRARKLGVESTARGGKPVSETTNARIDQLWDQGILQVDIEKRLHVARKTVRKRIHERAAQAVLALNEG